MKFRRQTFQTPTAANPRRFAHLWTAFLPLYFLTTATLDPTEVTNREYSQFVVATGHAPPEYWINGHYAAGKENEPVVLVNWHGAVAYCTWLGRRLPTVEEWTSTCQAGKLKKRANIWEWTSTDVDMGQETFKALCGPGNTCDCSHRYHPDWKNEVKGFRCSREAGPVAWLPLLFAREVFS